MVDPTVAEATTKRRRVQTVAPPLDKVEKKPKIKTANAVCEDRPSLFRLMLARRRRFFRLMLRNASRSTLLLSRATRSQRLSLSLFLSFSLFIFRLLVWFCSVPTTYMWIVRIPKRERLAQWGCLGACVGKNSDQQLDMGLYVHPPKTRKR